jgi:inosine-uridine nucleoside N-ribohydrolase
MNIAHPIGADRQMGLAWGSSEPRKSAASEMIIAVVKKLSPGEKLDIICTGAMTNIASAVAIDPSILPFVRCYALGARYNAAKGVWNKNEFNIRCDLNAFDYLLNNQKFDFTIMPTSTASPYRFVRDSLYSRLSDHVPVEKMLSDRWKETNPNDKSRTLWDLALVEAYLNPSFSTIVEVAAPPENTARNVKIYSKIDRNALTLDFWKSLKSIIIK